MTKRPSVLSAERGSLVTLAFCNCGRFQNTQVLVRLLCVSSVVNPP